MAQSPKSEVLRGRLARWLSDLEITDGLDSLVVKPHGHLGYAWEEVDEIVREFGGKWFKDSKPAKDDKVYLTHADGVWRIPK